MASAPSATVARVSMSRIEPSTNSTSTPARLLGDPVDRSSSTATSSAPPDASRWRQRFDPMKPAPPVTTTRIGQRAYGVGRRRQRVEDRRRSPDRLRPPRPAASRPARRPSRKRRPGRRRRPRRASRGDDGTSSGDDPTVTSRHDEPDQRQPRLAASRPCALPGSTTARHAGRSTIPALVERAVVEVDARRQRQQRRPSAPHERAGVDVHLARDRARVDPCQHRRQGVYRGSRRRRPGGGSGHRGGGVRRRRRRSPTLHLAHAERGRTWPVRVVQPRRSTTAGSPPPSSRVSYCTAVRKCPIEG